MLEEGPIFFMVVAGHFIDETGHRGQVDDPARFYGLVKFVHPIHQTAMPGLVFFCACVMGLLHELFFLCEVEFRVFGQGIEGRLGDRRHLTRLHGAAEGIRQREKFLMVLLTLFNVGVGLTWRFRQSSYLPRILRIPADGEIVQNG